MAPEIHADPPGTTSMPTTLMIDKRQPVTAVIVSTLLLMGPSPLTLAEAGPEDDELIIATRHAPPFAIRTPDGWKGITIDLLRQAAKEGGFSLSSARWASKRC
jgi:hypothetical protein